MLISKKVKSKNYNNSNIYILEILLEIDSMHDIIYELELVWFGEWIIQSVNWYVLFTLRLQPLMLSQGLTTFLFVYPHLFLLLVKPY